MKYVFKWSRHAFFCCTTKADGRKSPYTCFGMQTFLLLSLFYIQNGSIWSWFGMLKWVSISYVISLATSFKILSNSFDTSVRQNLLWLCSTFFGHCKVKSRFWEAIVNLRSTCLQCILLLFSFQFFKFPEAMTSSKGGVRSKGGVMMVSERVELLQQS